jgi:hypothetical protein
VKQYVKKLLLFLLLAGLAGVEYFHHRSSGHSHDASTHAAPHAKMDGARDLLRRHLHGH